MIFPAAIRAASVTNKPNVKNKANVDLTIGPFASLNSSAAGGPPIEATIPITPATRPVPSSVAGFRGTFTPVLRISTATITDSAIQISRVRWVATARSPRPRRAPGNLPRRSQTTPFPSIAVRSRSAIDMVSGIANSNVGTGAMIGLMRDRIGTVRIPSPTPIEPWVSDPTATTTSASSNSIGDTGMKSSVEIDGVWHRPDGEPQSARRKLAYAGFKKVLRFANHSDYDAARQGTLRVIAPQ